jgi:hypothetical protein
MRMRRWTTWKPKVMEQVTIETDDEGDNDDAVSEKLVDEMETEEVGQLETETAEK